MFIPAKVIGLCVALLTINGAVQAQTTVTTNGGTANAIPKFSGNATLVNSAITESNGNVGVAGTLGVYQGGFGVTSGTSGASGGFSNIALRTSGTNTNSGYAEIQAFYAGVAFNTPLALQAQGGNVGIGTSSPSGKLDVDGSGGLIVSGANLDPRGGYSLAPLQNSGKALMGWNYAAGEGEIDLLANRGPGGSGGFKFFDYSNSGILTPIFTIKGDGNIQVAGNVTLSGGGSITFPDGSNQSVAWNGTLCGGDYAESVDVSDDRIRYEPGDVLVIDPAHPGNFLKSSVRYSRLVAGIYSTKPGLVGRRQTTDPKLSSTEVPMAMVGIVPTKVTTENGPIEVGDLLVSSSLAAHAMKGGDGAIPIGTVIGKALGSLASGTGVIEVLVSLQ